MKYSDDNLSCFFLGALASWRFNSSPRSLRALAQRAVQIPKAALNLLCLCSRARMMVR
jgi:hypothetical protein